MPQNLAFFFLFSCGLFDPSAPVKPIAAPVKPIGVPLWILHQKIYIIFFIKIYIYFYYKYEKHICLDDNDKLNLEEQYRVKYLVL